MIPIRQHRITGWMNCAPSHRILAWAILTMLVLPASSALAANKLEGYYSLFLGGKREGNNWQFGPPGDNGMPNHYAELKFLSQPSDKFEIFSKLRAWSSRDDYLTTSVEYYNPPWLNAEGHLRLKDKKYDAYIFYRENRFYINDEPLLRLIDEGKLKYDNYGPQAQGVRFDFWKTSFLGIENLGGTVIISDSGTALPFGDTNYIARLRHEAWDGRIVSGTMFLRQDQGIDPRGLAYNHVYSGDISFSPRELVKTGLHLGPISLEQSRWTAEAAWSILPADEEDYNFSRYHARAWAVEVRDIHVDDITIHAWYNDFGENFRSYLSRRFHDDHQYNRIEKHAEAIWLVPRKSVTAKVSYDHSQLRVQEDPGGGLRPSSTWYAELYTEYVNGFTSRFAYRNWHGYDGSLEVNDFFSYPDWFAEVSVENFLAKVRLQARIHDAGTFRQVTIYGFDMNVNLTEKLTGYLRALNVNENAEARHTMFAQLKYDLGWGADLYFAYGDPGQSDNLAYTDWFVNESNGDNLRDQLQLTLSAWF